MKRLKFLIGVGIALLLTSALILFLFLRIRSEHDLVVCQTRADLLINAIDIFQKDNEGVPPNSLEDLRPAYFDGEPVYYDSWQKRSIQFNYRKKGNSVMLSSEVMPQGWAGRRIRVIAFNNQVGETVIPEELYDSELKKFEELK